MDIPKHFMYLSYDGDGIGRKVGRAILANDIDELRRISHLIEAGHTLVREWVKESHGIWINGGGDEGNAAIPKEHADGVERIRKDYENLVGATMSVGLGDSPSEAGRALLIAKLKGKDQTVEFDEATEIEIKAIKRRAKKGALKSMEEYKLAEAYLNKSESDELCPYCQQSEVVDPEHCLFCHDAEVAGDSESCPFCAENTVDSKGILDSENCEFCKQSGQIGESDCPYCNAAPKTELADTPTAPNPTAEDEDIANREKQAASIEDMGQNPPAIDKQSPQLVSAEVPVASEAAEPEAPIEAAPALDPEDNSSKEALSAIAQQIEAEGSPPASAVNNIDDTALPVGNEIEGNISRPEGYGANTAGDMGLGGTNGPEENGEDPDLSSILEEGLNEHADGIQREKVIQMTSQALQQFKGCKQILENAKLQTPQLYSASITMLKAMIEMASLLGLGEGLPQNAGLGQNAPELGQAQAALTPQPDSNEWHELFPAHPDNGGSELKPGHAPPSKSSKEDGSQAPQP